MLEAPEIFYFKVQIDLSGLTTEYWLKICVLEWTSYMLEAPEIFYFKVQIDLSGLTTEYWLKICVLEWTTLLRYELRTIIYIKVLLWQYNYIYTIEDQTVALCLCKNCA
jgi:hypothetical protein